ncbi:MAG: hypothetical protein CVU60_08390 [Deltaproteobacteria bacterium HGW-Deltaproteobacteria-18]|nr:MAG: hypothetical protein CVU60_08390 [Deltaproteobacteria bacterium HGW-Deltaproteobacteria-18]
MVTRGPVPGRPGIGATAHERRCFPEAIASAFPHADVQLCLVHMVRHCIKFSNGKQRKEVAADLKAI